MKILLTCEHAVNTIPERFKAAFKAEKALLETHRGVDFHAQDMARTLATTCHLPYMETTTSRLLIDCNRSLHHPHCFSFISKALNQHEKKIIIQTYYQPHRDAVLSFIQANQPVLHFAIHSFTPSLNGVIRQADLGLLYDPARKKEQQLAIQCQRWFKQQAPHYRTRRNYPYLGKSDGLATWCRHQFSETQYVGFEIEFNQATLSHPTHQQALSTLFSRFLRDIQVGDGPFK